MSEKQPNFLLIITDQQRADTVGLVGKTRCQTPNLDRLAREGISFDRSLTPCPLCTPARAAIFTGQYPHQVDLMQNNVALRAAPTLTQRLRTRGYHTAYAGKWHLDAQTPAYLVTNPSERRRADTPSLRRWFDRFGGQSDEEYTEWCMRNGLPDGRAFNDLTLRTSRWPAMTVPRTAVLEMKPEVTHDAWITDHAIRLLAECPKDTPFFLVCAYYGPHPPFKIPEPYYSMYDPHDIPEPPNFKPSSHKPQAVTTSYFHQLWLDHGEHWEAWQKSIAVYWGFVTLLDNQIGRLLRAMEAKGVLDDTCIIFTSDHGEMLGQHGLWQKMMPYEEAIRVPLIMRYQGFITPGLRSQVMASLVDIAPTILAIAGESKPEEMAGIDLSPSFRDGVEFQPEPCRYAEHKPLSEWHHAVEWRLVTDDHLKYVWNQGDLDELYDLENDPFEQRNCIDAPGCFRELEHLRGKLLNWMKQTTDPLLPSFAGELGISI